MIDESQRLHHLTLNTGDLTTPRLDKIDARALEITEAWLRERVATPDLPMPLPGWGEHGYSALTLSVGDTMLQTVYGPSGAPLVTFGVAAAASPDAEELWHQLSGMDGALSGSLPLYPWCVVMVHPSALLHTDALAWLGDYERCVALAWLRIIETQTTRSP